MRTLLPYLTDDQGRSLSVSALTVVPNALPTPLQDGPQGWENSLVQFERNTEFMAMIKSYVTALKFYSEGARILRFYYYTKGIEAVLFFIWTKLDQSFGGGLIHKGWYKGEPDFTTYKDETDGVEISITEGGLFKDLQVNKTVPYEILFDDDAASLLMDGLDIENEADYTVSEGVEYSDLVNFLPSIGMVAMDGTNFALDVTSQSYEVLPTNVTDLNTNLFASTNYFQKNILTNKNQAIKYVGKVIVFCIANPTSPASSIRFSFRTSYARELGDIFNFTPVAGHSYTFDVNTILTLQPGEKLFVMGRMGSVNPSLFRVLFVEGSQLVSTWINDYDPTVIDVHTIYNVGNKLMGKLSDGKSSLQSNLLTNDVNTLITSGDAIRSIPGAVIKTKFSDYHKSVDALKCISFGVENNNGRLENRINAFDNTTQIAHLGEATDVVIETANEFIYDTVNSGYPTTDIDKLNGKYSFCNTYVYKATRKRDKNTYDCTSIYKADPYVAESLRINLQGKKTTDDKSDNDVFFFDAEKNFITFSGNANFDQITKSITLLGVHLTLYPNLRFTNNLGNNTGHFKVASTKLSGANTVLTVEEPLITESNVPVDIEFRLYKLRREALTYTGVPTNSIFNVRLSPKRNLMNHYSWIRSSCDFLDGQKLSIQTTDKNKDFSTDDGAGNVITEFEDIPINNMGPKIYRPYRINLKVQTQLNLIEKIEATPGGYFSFDIDGGMTLKGFHLKIKTNEATLATQDYEFLSTPDNDFTPLINRS